MSLAIRNWVMMFVLAFAVIAPAPALAAADLIEWNNVTAVTGSGKPATAEEIKRAFTVGGARRGWTFTDAGPDKMILKLDVRTHTLMMELTYETGKYSLKYKESINLDYKDEAGKRTIHRSYVNWNTNLMNDARSELMRL
jgi:hypothetical protein